MIAADQEAFDTLRRRVDHVAETASLLADHAGTDPDTARYYGPLEHIAETLRDLAARMNSLTITKAQA